jgi:excisionase family DNA binding protein
MDKLLTPDDIAEILGIGRETFDDIRRAGNGPREVKLGHRTIRFRPQDVDAWLIERSKAA